MKRYVAALLMLIPSVMFSQISSSNVSQAEDFGRSVYGLGFSAGWASGIGISFRDHLPTKVSLQAVFGIIKTSEKLSMSIGGEMQYDLVRREATRFFGVMALSYQYYGDDGNELQGPFRMGLGAGCELKIQDTFHVSGEALFTFFSDGRVIPLPQIACHYYFN